jgi:carbonic anhydrase
LKDGLIKPVFEMEAGTHIDTLYEFDDLWVTFVACLSK